MAKHKPQRALFEILAKEKAQRRAAEEQAGPVVRRMGGGAERAPAARPAPFSPPAADQTARAAPRRGPTAEQGQSGRLNVDGIPPALKGSNIQQGQRGGLERLGAKYAWVAIAAAGVLGLCVFFLLLGRWLGGPSLPNVPERPPMEEVREGPTETGLVVPAPPPPAPAPVPVPAPGELGGEQRPAPNKLGGEQRPAPGPEAAGKYRLRIARLEVSRSEYTDQLRTLLAERGVETDLEARSGYFVMYSRARFAAPDADAAKAFLEKVEEIQKAFEQKTGWPATTNPYFVTVP